jgi:hypothetical protein
VLASHGDLAMDVATAFFNVRGYGLPRDELNGLGSVRLLHEDPGIYRLRRYGSVSASLDCAGR